MKALKLMVEYYSQRYRPEDIARLVPILAKADVPGLVTYAYEEGKKSGSLGFLYGASREATGFVVESHPLKEKDA